MTKFKAQLSPLTGLLFLATWCMFALLAVSLFLAKIWLLASLATSAVKSLSENCGKEYYVEAVVSGNWFCPKE